ncbi:MAG TPA: D-aminoacylase [Pseudomonadales bacterium]|nr:D-aminoacylase [Pseudomonadales bacterium]
MRRFLLVLCCALSSLIAATGSASTLIRGALLVDGTGAPAVRADVRIEGDRIAAIGALAPRAGETLVDAQGLVLAPGFVDTHSHHGSDADRDVIAAISQGITTIVVGQDGGSVFPLEDFFADRVADPRAVNVASYTGHGTLRERVMGDGYERQATDAEVARMAALLEADMAAGSLGLATGLEYDPGIYSAQSEVIALARAARRWGGRYISHMRSEDRQLEAAIEELIEIGRAADIPVQISHMKLARRGLWGQAPRLLARLDAARAEGVDVTADIYPYEYWGSSMTVLFPERNFDDPEAARYALTELVAPEEMILGTFDAEPAYAGLTLAEVAAFREEDPVDTYMALIAMARAADADESIVARSMTSEDIEAILAWPHSNVCSDGAGEGAHPRGFGAFPKVLATHVRERGVLGLEEAIRKMTWLSAQHVGLADRGLVAVGAPADLVLFDAARVADRATFDAPHRRAVGIDGVWVNGERVLVDGEATGARPGRVLRR